MNQQAALEQAREWHVDVPLDSLKEHLERYVVRYGCNLDPDFQRPHVWTEEQQVRYVEHILRSGHSGRDILFNCPGWSQGERQNFVLVDGKQRLEALRRFYDDELPVFGLLYSKYEGRPRTCTGLHFHINDLYTRAEVLQWYLDYNTGGTVHTDEEIARVKKLLEIERAKETR